MMTGCGGSPYIRKWIRLEGGNGPMGNRGRGGGHVQSIRLGEGEGKVAPGADGRRVVGFYHR
jgi:hypothetical protein